MRSFDHLSFPTYLYLHLCIHEVFWDIWSVCHSTQNSFLLQNTYPHIRLYYLWFIVLDRLFSINSFLIVQFLIVVLTCHFSFTLLIFNDNFFLLQLLHYFFVAKYVCRRNIQSKHVRFFILVDGISFHSWLWQSQSITPMKSEAIKKRIDSKQ